MLLLSEVIYMEKIRFLTLDCAKPFAFYQDFLTRFPMNQTGCFLSQQKYNVKSTRFDALCFLIISFPFVSREKFLRFVQALIQSHRKFFRWLKRHTAKPKQRTRRYHPRLKWASRSLRSEYRRR